MRFFAVLALAVSASAAITRRQSLPNCATSCLLNADFGSCSATDDSCLCHSQSFISSVTTCIEGACSGSDLTAAESAAQQLCLAVGVTLSSTSTSTSTSSATSADSSATHPASSGGSSATTSGSSAAAANTGASNTTNGAAAHGVNALAALAAVGAAALVF